MKNKELNKKVVINTFILPSMKKNKIKPYVNNNNEYERDKEYERNERRMKNFKENHNSLFCLLFVCFPLIYCCSLCKKNNNVNNLNE